MAIEAISKALSTTKKYFWRLLLMTVPYVIIYFVLTGLEIYFMKETQIMNLNDIFTSGVSMIMRIVITLITNILGMSIIMGYLLGEKDGHFPFKNAFAVFTRGNTWLISIGYLLLIIVIMILYAGVTIGGIWGIATLLGSFSLNVWLKLLIAIVGIGLIIAWFFLYAYVGLGLQFMYLAYFEAKGQNKHVSFFYGIRASLEMMKGHRWSLFGFKFTLLLVALAIFLLLGIIGIILWAIFAVALSLKIVGDIFLILIGLMAVAVFLFFNVWIFMGYAKFYEEIK
ncbi:hypothetical protein [Fructilactobacillus fructivorans]|uniref:DUF975 family protein n=1 Tax=Fructilactobacillus fructivorans TaxID=1614 RepID=A0AAE6TW15_9LACO|nr:hypothetical protein [Fructilactobacillus fructivorans]KRK58284.1 hypothetical protein FC73_GL000670 [Fructilactobacillus fructivorans]KRN12873.1 hypothetical protein IV37_GL000502 [Fructilactobacillus fructivorans]KRN40838.1 hypothetical protein IV51_GL001063 [Fructilactobacillus fructivorans]KRN42262.1 hypothetical protein IV48_GL000444 [Fructilactobacillus fructivorans]QFX92262.1 hypothetical protein LF543_01130 [Fructilactobacillus fructivorans]